MDAEDTDRIGIRILLGQGTARLHYCFQMGEEGIESAARGVFKTAGFVVQCLQINPCRAGIHGGIPIDQRKNAAFLIQTEDQLVCAHTPGILPQILQSVEKFFAAAAQSIVYTGIGNGFLRAHSHRIPQASVGNGVADPHKIVQREAEHGTLHGGGQMDVPRGVINGTEYRQHKENLRLFV